MSKKRLIIVDVSNFIFRAFFAIRPLTSPEGTPVNAVYGVFSMMLKLLSEHRPTHIFLARDTKGGSFRNKLYDAYKANRSEAPEDLIPQFALIDELIQKMQLPTFSHDDFEADDIIGSAAIQWKDQFDEILIASGDKDLMQFVGGNIHLLDTMKDKIYHPNDVEEKMGVKPEQIVDYLSIVGDSSDNIPGMKGIGAKGAADLLKEWGTLENIIANKDKLKGKRVIDAFQNHLDDAILSKKLVQIVTDLDIGHSVDETQFKFYPSDDLIAFMNKLGFKSAITKLMDLRFQENRMAMEEQNAGNDSIEIQDYKMFSGVTEEVSKVEVKELSEENYSDVLELIKLQKTMSLVLEFDTEDFATQKIKALAFSLVKDLSYNVNLNLMDKFLKDLLAQNIELVLSDVKALFRYCYFNKLNWNASFFDISHVHYLLNTTGKHEIDFILKEYLGIDTNVDDPNVNFIRSGALITIAEKQKERLDKLNVSNIYYNIDLKLMPVLARMEFYGVSLNERFFHQFEEELSLEIEKLETKIFEVAGEKINLNSPKQVGVLLFEKLNLPVIKKTKTGVSTDAEVLEELDAMGSSEIPGMLLLHREYNKILSTYVKALPKLVNPTTNRLHTTFNQNVAETGRLSSTNPNIQNIPVRTELGRKVRKGFIAEPGKLLLSADYSQVELRLLAHFSEDPTMLKAFQENQDIHAQTAAEVLDIPLNLVKSSDRSMAKTVNFGLMYGQSSFGLASTLKISRTEAKAYIEKYFNRFSSIKTFLDTLKDKAEQTGFTETLFGRKRLVPDIHSQNRTIKAQAERMAINSPIQGTAADIIKIAMINISDEMTLKSLKSKMLLQVHDELIFEVVEEELDLMQELVKRQMEGVVNLKVPLKVDMGIGVNWFDLK